MRKQACKEQKMHILYMCVDTFITIIIATTSLLLFFMIFCSQVTHKWLANLSLSLTASIKYFIFTIFFYYYFNFQHTRLLLFMRRLYLHNSLQLAYVCGDASVIDRWPISISMTLLASPLSRLLAFSRSHFSLSLSLPFFQTAIFHSHKSFNVRTAQMYVCTHVCVQ